MSRVIAVVACGFSLAACSTSLPSLSLLKPPSETLRIESEPPGADAKTTLGQSCRTPCELAVQSGDDLAVTLTLSGYQPQTVAVQREASARLAPNPIFVELEPAPAPPAKKPIKKKPRVAKAHPAPPVITGATASAAPPPAAAAAPAAAAPAAAPPPMPATPAEPAVSATNYPWPSR
jgi:PEGA domain